MMRTSAVKRRRSAVRSARRQAAKSRFNIEQDRAKRWVAQFDTDNSKTLDKDEFKKLMTHMNNGTEPTDGEVNKVFRRADYRKTGDLDSEEIIVAVSKWKSMLEEQEFINDLFQKFDADGSGLVDKIELKALLTDLNDNNAPTDEEVEDIIFRVDTDNNGTINKEELKPAIETWYLDRKLLKEEEKEKANAKSSACSIM